MPEHDIAPKAIVEGPPTPQMRHPVAPDLFKALEEPVSFQSADGNWRQGTHTARFGEIEQRGIALTPKGRALYDELLASASRQIVQVRLPMVPMQRSMKKRSQTPSSASRTDGPASAPKVSAIFPIR